MDNNRAAFPVRAEARGHQDQFFDPAAPFGPLELNLLERVENGLNDASDGEDNNKEVETPGNEINKYEGPKQVIFVTGWVNIDSMYQRYKYGFICKILIGVALIGCLLYNNHNFMPIAAILVLINLVHVFKNIYYLVAYRKSNYKIRTIFIAELHISIGYLIYFIGFLLLFTHLITTKFFLFYSLPYMLLTIFFFFYNAEDSVYLSQKKFLIFEGFQLFLIAVKFSQISFIDWNYTLIFFMTASIYLTVIGLLLTIILSCSLFGFMYRDLEAWKLRSLIWMTWYYLWSGMIYIYVIKGIIQYYSEDNMYERPLITDYTKYKSTTYDILMGSGLMMVFFSFVNLIMHMLWKEDIKKYLAKVIYKDELRKEISLRFLTKSFTFSVIQVSSTYFTKPDPPVPKSEEDGSGDSTALEVTTTSPVTQAESEHKDTAPEGEIDLCVFCYHETPNIMIDSCGHGGICKECMLCYLRNDSVKCPFCKGPVQKLYLLTQDPKTKDYHATGEIKLRS